MCWLAKMSITDQNERNTGAADQNGQKIRPRLTKMSVKDVLCRPK